MTTLLLIRHGHSVANADGILAGWTPEIGLTDLGRDQISALRAHLAGIPVVQVVSSPVQRCRDSAAALFPSHPIDTDDGLGECHYGAWTGRVLTELTDDPLWRTVQDEPQRARFPDDPREHGYAAESLAEMTERVSAALLARAAAIEQAHGPDAIWAAISHGDPIKSAVATVSGAGVAGLQRFHVSPASVTVLRWTRSQDQVRPMLIAMNSRGEGIADLVKLSKPAAAQNAADITPGGGDR